MNRTVFIYYTFNSKVKAPDLLVSYNHELFIQRIFDIQTKTFRPLLQECPIRRQLEIIKFGRQNLIDKFANPRKYTVRYLVLLYFIDRFGLYRNIYRKLIGIYFIAAGLTAQQRNRRTNVLPFTLGLYSSNMDDVIKAIGPILRTLDRGQRIRFLDKDKDSMLYTSVLAYLGDILQ